MVLSQTLTDQDEDALALLMGDDECPDDVIEAAAVLCSVDHESGRTTDPRIMSWDEFGTYSHLSNGRREGPFNANGNHCVVRTSDGAACVSGVGMFGQQAAQQQDSARVASLRHGDSSFSSPGAGAKK